MAINIQDIVEDGKSPGAYLAKTRIHKVTDPKDVKRDNHSKDFKFYHSNSDYTTDGS
jgi:hypothetical protein